MTITQVIGAGSEVTAGPVLFEPNQGSSPPPTRLDPFPVIWLNFWHQRWNCSADRGYSDPELRPLSEHRSNGSFGNVTGNGARH